MAPIKRRPRMRSHHKMKPRRRKTNISELVYKFLTLDGGKEGGTVASSRGREAQRCRFCKLRKRHEVLDSPDSRTAGSMANKRKDSSRNSRIHRVKRRQTSRDHTLSACMQKCNGGEGVKKMKKYIQKAIDFGVESGYLIPKDAAYKLLRVSSDLMNDGNYAGKVRKSVSRVSQVRDKSPRRTPIKFEDYEVQEARRRRKRRRSGRRRRRRRSRSGSRRRRRSRRRRGRRRSGSTHEQVIDNENDNEYEYNKQGEKKSSPDNANRKESDDQQNQSDGEKTENKREDDGSEDVSMDEDESDEEDDEKKRDEPTKT